MRTIHFYIKGLPYIGDVNVHVSGQTDEAIIAGLRNHLASKVPRIPFTRKDDAYRENLDMDGKDDWPPERFREVVTGLYNLHIRKADDPTMKVPLTDSGLIAKAIELGLATEA